MSLKNFSVDTGFFAYYLSESGRFCRFKLKNAKKIEKQLDKLKNADILCFLLRPMWCGCLKYTEDRVKKISKIFKLELDKLRKCDIL